MRIDRIEFEGAMIKENPIEMEIRRWVELLGIRFSGKDPLDNPVWNMNYWERVDDPSTFVYHLRETRSLFVDIMGEIVKAPATIVPRNLFLIDEQDLFFSFDPCVRMPSPLERIPCAEDQYLPIITMKRSDWLIERRIFQIESDLWAISSELFPCSEDAVFHIITPNR